MHGKRGEERVELLECVQVVDREAGGPYSLPVGGNLISTDGAILHQAALAGLGVTVLPAFMVGRDLQAGRLRALLEPHRTFTLGIYGVCVHKQQPAHARAFVDHLARLWKKGFSDQ